MPFFSIVIPTHNRPNLLPRALESVFNQSFHSYEVIVVNDGSLLYYDEVLNQFVGKIQYIQNSESMGVAAARNIGIQKAVSEWIVFLDDDDQFNSNFLLNLYWRLQLSTKDHGFSWSSVVHLIYDASGNPITQQITYFDAQYKTQGELHAQAMRIGCGYGFAVKRACFEAVGGFDPSYRIGEDTDLIFRLLSAGYEPIVCTDIGVIIHEHSNNRLTPNFTEHAKTGVYEKLIAAHEKYIAKYPELLSRFMGWAATVYYMVGDFNKGNKILKKMLAMNCKNLLVWKKYLQIMVRRSLIRRQLKPTLVLGEK